ncbi:MAG: hypothetical protein K1X79_00955 [Oligoflexia bacterium]|nr:hypothetical protein [Oligoflexia bacterium]
MCKRAFFLAGLSLAVASLSGCGITGVITETKDFVENLVGEGSGAEVQCKTGIVCVHAKSPSDNKKLQEKFNKASTNAGMAYSITNPGTMAGQGGAMVNGQAIGTYAAANHLSVEQVAQSIGQLITDMINGNPPANNLVSTLQVQLCPPDTDKVQCPDQSLGEVKVTGDLTGVHADFKKR